MTTFRMAVRPDPVLPARPAGRADARVLSIDSALALARLRRSLWLPQPNRPGTRIILQEHALGAEAKRAEGRVNALHASCGCGAGGIAVVGTVVGLVARWAFGNIVLDGRALLVGLGALAAAAVGGKVVGIAWSRALLFLLLWRLERRLTLMQQGEGVRLARDGAV